MEKTKKPEHTSPVKKKTDDATVKITKTITDQNTGQQQLYESRKVRPSTNSKEVTTNAKKVRQNAGKKLDKLIRKDSSDTEQRESSTEQTNKLNK